MTPSGGRHGEQQASAPSGVSAARVASSLTGPARPPLVGTALAEAIGSYAGAFGLLAGVVVAAVVLAWRGGHAVAGAQPAR